MLEEITAFYIYFQNGEVLSLSMTRNSNTIKDC